MAKYHKKLKISDHLKIEVEITGLHLKALSNFCTHKGIKWVNTGILAAIEQLPEYIALIPRSDPPTSTFRTKRIPNSALFSKDQILIE